MELIYESNNKIESPFFSVCIETFNRGETIYKALDSLLHQNFTEFECVIVDDCSSDNTLSEILRFTESSDYKNTPYDLKFYKNHKKLGGVLNWNSPLEIAKGKYIAGLEGDDHYMPGYLNKAFLLLNQTPNVGVYSSGSQRAKRPLTGLIKSKDYFLYLYSLKNISPPSEFIFIRQTKNGNNFTFDVINNIYAPEIQLLLSIADDGWDAYHSEDSDIYRGPSTSYTYMTWKFFADKFYIIEKYKTHRYVSNKDFEKSFQRQIILSIRRYIVSDYQKKGNSESLKNGIIQMLGNNNAPYKHIYMTLYKGIILLKRLGFFKLYFYLKNLSLVFF